MAKGAQEYKVRQDHSNRRQHPSYNFYEVFLAKELAHGFVLKHIP